MVWAAVVDISTVHGPHSSGNIQTYCCMLNARPQDNAHKEAQAAVNATKAAAKREKAKKARAKQDEMDGRNKRKGGGGPQAKSTFGNIE